MEKVVLNGKNKVPNSEYICRFFMREKSNDGEPFYKKSDMMINNMPITIYAVENAIFELRKNDNGYISVNRNSIQPDFDNSLSRFSVQLYIDIKTEDIHNAEVANCKFEVYEEPSMENKSHAGIYTIKNNGEIKSFDELKNGKKSERIRIQEKLLGLVENLYIKNGQSFIKIPSKKGSDKIFILQKD